MVTRLLKVAPEKSWEMLQWELISQAWYSLRIFANARDWFSSLGEKPEFWMLTFWLSKFMILLAYKTFIFLPSSVQPLSPVNLHTKISFFFKTSFSQGANNFREWSSKSPHLATVLHKVTIAYDAWYQKYICLWILNVKVNTHLKKKEVFLVIIENFFFLPCQKSLKAFTRWWMNKYLK